MAVGTVSGVDQQDNWQLISSTTASGTSMTLSSFTGYKHLWITGVGITKSASDFPEIRPNNDTSNGSYASSVYAPINKFTLAPQSSAASAFSAKIYDIDKTIPHKVEWGFDPAAMGSPQDAYVNPVAITSVVLFNRSGASFTGGTVYVYGIPA